MEPRVVHIGGYPVRQLSETEYEADNATEKLDFHFQAESPDGPVVVLIFDGEKSTEGEDDSFMDTFEADTLEEAVNDAMTWKR